ncbi:MAG: UTP--glucose-1-phosphate uridylyltransferase [Rhabdochlamydiaceae bacterium]|nr:UTP--glucose-1-phosphate uridylyltransferase [Rhabdochlamydiaceae bacterium]
MLTTTESNFMRLKALASALKNSSSLQDKLDHLNTDLRVRSFNESASYLTLKCFMAGLSLECELVLKSLIAIEQWDQLVKGLEEGCASERLRALIFSLLPVERFYQEIGGIVGYQAMMLQLFSEEGRSPFETRCIYNQPVGIDLVSETASVKQAILAGIEFLPMLAEIYPVGGAADRLRLCDPTTLMPLPAAKLRFCGRTLLERLVIDLQAREYLYYKLFKKQLTTPIAMMTSQEKDNHAQILAMCQEQKWFGRPASSFAFFCQPTVPTMNKEGQWCLIGPCKPLMKPGGHGVMWKVAKDQGVFEWLKSLGRAKVLVRQINNLISGCDYGLLAFTGIGCAEDKAFGFASCFRQVQSAEGVNVLIVKEEGERTEYCLTNIEYCDFKKFGIYDEPAQEGSAYSKFPSNTNILFADIEKVLEKIEECPIPGMLVNFKKMTYSDENGVIKEEDVARLESTMQNIADCFIENFESSADVPQLKTFLTFNHRRKTISTAKKEFQEGGSLLETPEGCYHDYMHNVCELLRSHCRFTVPEASAFDFVYHPALGPLYHIIAQKLQGGLIKEGSECLLEIAELCLEDIYIDGSLQIIAEQVMGHEDQDRLVYSERVGSCVFRRVRVCNLGIDRAVSKSYWKSEVHRLETCEIRLLGRSEFIAEDVCFEGPIQIIVEDGFRVVASMENQMLQLKKEPIADGEEGVGTSWVYEAGEEGVRLLK